MNFTETLPEKSAVSSSTVKLSLIVTSTLSLLHILHLVNVESNLAAFSKTTVESSSLGLAVHATI